MPRQESAVGLAHAELRKAVATLLLLAFPFAACASPAAAKRLYDNGRFKESQQEYERLMKKSGDVKWPAVQDALKKFGEAKHPGGEDEFLESLQNVNLGDARLHFNAGVAAYKAGDLENATKHFTLALTSPDLNLQERAFYNFGNTLYRAGEQNQGMNEKIQLWENAVQSFHGAVQLDGKDADARYNLEFVKKKLEELKKQQPKQDQKQQQNPKQDKEDKEKQQQDRKEQPDSSKQQQKQEQKQRPAKPDPQQEQKDRQQQDNRLENADNQKQKEDQAKQNKPQGAGKSDEKSGEQAEANAAPTPGQMTVREAQQLLDSQKGEERAMIFVPQQKLKDQRRVFKDW